MTFTRSSDILTVVRGQHGTTAKSASEGGSVQECKIYDNVNVVDIIYDQLVNFAGIPASYIPYNNDPANPDEWDVEYANWLTLKDYYTIISKPTGVQTLIEELTEQSLIMLWWDEASQKIKLKVIAPPGSGEVVTSINDNYHILEKSLSVKHEDAKRYTEIWVYYGVKNWVEVKDEEDYETLYIHAELDKEGVDLYGDKRIKKIKSRWITTDSQAVIYSGRFMLMSKETPVTVTLKVDAKDSDIKTGDFIDMTTRVIVGQTGEAVEKRYHVVEVKESSLGHEYQLTLITSGFLIGVSYGYIAPNTAPDYGSATEEEKDTYAYIAPNTGNFPDGREPYKII